MRLPIAGVLLVGVAGLVLAAVASVLYIGLATSRQNTFDLLRDKAELGFNSIVGQLQQHLTPVAQQAEFLATQTAAGELPLEDKPRLADMLFAALAATPQVAEIALIETGGQTLRVTRTGSVLIEGPAGLPRARYALERASRSKQSEWGPITRDSDREDPSLYLIQPLWRNGAFVGALMSQVTIGELSRYLSQMPIGSSGTPFILEGRDHVLAHPNLAVRTPETANGDLLPGLDGVGDPVLREIWSPKAVEVLRATTRARPIRAETVSGIGGKNYLYLYGTIEDFGGRWLVGTHFTLDQVDRELDRLSRATLAGAAVLIIAIIAALALSRWLGRPIRRLAAAAESVRGLDFAASGPAMASSIRELDDAANAFNQMLAGLRWFETYVPRALVMRLMRRSEDQPALSEERIVTVMFTDITGFTALAEQMGAAELASLLNHHFTIVNRCVEAEEGIVDKYIGDSVMSFWNAPTGQPDHALRATRAASAIARAVKSDNQVREADGLKRLRMRIAIHSGRAVVGNIGSPGRINYTIVGDTVNAAARLLTLNRELHSEISLLVSSDVAEAAGLPSARLKSLGQQSLRGRASPIEVYELVPDDAVAEAAKP